MVLDIPVSRKRGRTDTSAPPGGLFVGVLASRERSRRSNDSDGAFVEAGETTGTTTASPTRKTTADCIKFRRPEMLRGTSVDGVLQGFGRIFVNNEGSASTFELSVPVTEIDVFLSHNWSTPRFDKYCALALHFNLGKAIVTTGVSALLSVPLTVAGYLPMFEFAVDATEGQSRKQAVSAHLIGMIVLLLTIALAHEVSLRLGCRGPVAFLDKTCICQTDPELKQEGIEGLAAFLEHSRAMVVLYSKTYLKKLWTVYELASLQLLHPERKVVVIPCFLPKMVLSGFLAYSFFMVFHRLTLLRRVAEATRSVPGLGDATLGCTLLFSSFLGVLFLVILEDWAKDRAEIKEVLQSFSIGNAMCFDESDRLLVQGNITSFMRDLGIVKAHEGEGQDSFQHRALEAFDVLVRAEIPPALAFSFGRQGIPYRYVALMCSSSILRGMDQLAPCISGHITLRIFVVVALEHLTVALALAPLAMAACFSGVQRAVSSSRGNAWRRRLQVLLVFALVIAGNGGVWYFLTVSSEWASDDDKGLAVYCILVFVLFLLALLAYRPVRIQAVGRTSTRLVLAATVADVAARLRSASRTVFFQ